MVSHFLTRQQGRPVVEKVASLFRSPKLMIRRDQGLLFVCGGSMKSGEMSLRQLFMRDSENKLPKYKTFLAESSFRDLINDGSHEFINIADLEKIIADVADCVLIFPESPGSLAEVGFFSCFPKIRPKILIANDLEYQTKSSFLNDGPIHTISRMSQFGSTVYFPKVHNKWDFSPVFSRLDTFKPRRSYRLDATSRPATLREQLYVAIGIFYILPILSMTDLSIIMTEIFGRTNSKTLRRLVSILVSTKYVFRVKDDDLYVIGNDIESFIDIEGRDLNVLRAELRESYQKHVPHLMQLASTPGTEVIA